MTSFNKILVAIVLLFLTLVVAVSASVYSLVLNGRLTRVTAENQKAIERIESLTLELAQLKKDAEVANCVATNISRAAIRQTFKDSLLELVPAGTILDAEQKLRVALYNDRVDRGLPFRDCSPAGIELWIQNQPPDPALAEGGN